MTLLANDRRGEFTLIDIRSLINMSSSKKFEAGAVIVTEGDNSSEEMYILLKGNVGVYKNYKEANEIQIATLDPGDFFGEMTLFINKSRTATVVALSEAVVLVLNYSNTLEFFKTHPDVTLSFIKTLCLRLDTLNNSYEKLHSQTLPPGGKKTPNQASGSEGNKPVLTTQPSQDQKQESAPKQSPSNNASLFPEGHGQYTLTFDNGNKEFLFEKGFACPNCGHAFKALAVKSSKLTPEQTDRDLRVHYKGIEPLYYDIVICPKCWFSALSDIFKDGIKAKDFINETISPFKAEFALKFGAETDTFTIIAGYYLALLCTQKCYRKPDLIQAKLWLKLSRIYQDCQDDKMELYASQQALDAYLHAFEHISLPLNQYQQLYIMIGELCYKLGDADKARNYFFKAKTDKEGSNVYKRHAEDRLDDIKAVSQQTEESDAAKE